MKSPRKRNGSAQDGWKIILFSSILLLTVSRGSAQTTFNPFGWIGTNFDGVAMWVNPYSTHYDDVRTKGAFGNQNTPFSYGAELLIGPFSTYQYLDVIDSVKSRASRMEIKKWMQDSLYKTGLNFGDTVKAINDILGKLRDEEDSSWSFEFGIGLDYSDSYGHQWDTVHLGRGDTLDISAPMLGYYLSGYADSPWYILPDVNLYFGGTAGFYSTQNATATTPKMGSFAINGNTFALEGLVGGSWPFAKRGASSFFVEVGYHYLKTTYASTDPKTYPIKRPGPVSLDLSGFHLSVGIEFAKKSD